MSPLRARLLRRVGAVSGGMGRAAAIAAAVELGASGPIDGQRVVSLAVRDGHLLDRGEALVAEPRALAAARRLRRPVPTAEGVAEPEAEEPDVFAPVATAPMPSTLAAARDLVAVVGQEPGITFSAVVDRLPKRSKAALKRAVALLTEQGYLESTLDRRQTTDGARVMRVLTLKGEPPADLVAPIAETAAVAPPPPAPIPPAAPLPVAAVPRVPRHVAQAIGDLTPVEAVAATLQALDDAGVLGADIRYRLGVMVGRLVRS